MKKLLSLLLALTLLVSLTIPSLAAEPDSEQEWTDWKSEYTAAHPEEVAAFDPDAWFLESFPCYDSKEELMEMYELETEADFDAYMLEDWFYQVKAEEEQQAWLDQYEADHPGAISNFDPDAYFQEHFYEDPKAAFMKENSLADEAQFQDLMMRSYISALQQEEWLQNLMDDYEAEHPGAIAAFDPDAYFAENFSYYDSKEEYMEYSDLDEEGFREDMLMTWLQSFTWENDWNDEREAYKRELGGIPGELGVMLNGAYLKFPEGKKPYAKDGATMVPADVWKEATGLTYKAGSDGYIPLRAAADEAGYQVFWDQYYDTVVLLDSKAAIAEIDESFTVLNSLLKLWTKEGEANYKSSLTLRVDYTKLDSFDGDKSYPATASAEVITGPAGLALTGKYDFTALKVLYAGMADWMDPAELARMEEMLKGDFTFLQNAEENIAYARMSFFTQLFANMGTNYPKDIWIPIPGEELPPLLIGQPLTVGSLLYQWNVGGYSYSGVNACENLMWEAQNAARIWGDDNFKKDGKGWSYELDKEAFGLLMDPEDPEYYTEDLKDFSLKLKISETGSVTLDFFFESIPYDYYYYGNATRVTATGSLTPEDFKLDITISVKNESVITLHFTGKSGVSSTPPTVEPPKDAVIAPMEDLYSSYEPSY